MLRTLLSVLLIICASVVTAQDTIRVGLGQFPLNESITDRFTLYESAEWISWEDFLKKKQTLRKRKLRNSIENLDFTTSTFFIDFVLENRTDRDISLVLETARPITNEASLYRYSDNTALRSGDAVPFHQKAIYTNRSALPLSVSRHSSERFILRLGSDGEIISLPLVLWEEEAFEKNQKREQFLSGIFYGIFLFVIVIYLTFYYMLRDRLFLVYSIYVLMSGLLQFALDGYFHQFVFTAGDYLTQHVVIVVAGLTVFFALNYASGYLKLSGKMQRITMGFAWVVIATVLLSLIPGKIYEICYPLINGFSFLGVMYLLFIAFRIRRNNPEVSRLFLIGLSTLLAGAVIFILGNFSVLDAPELTQNSLKAGTLVEIICLSILMAGKYKALQDEKEAVQRQLVIELEAKNQLMNEANVRLEQEVAERTKEIEEQRAVLKEKNDDLLASITYAERIQRALLSNEAKFREILPDSFIFYRPKDIVSGDFFWIDTIPGSERWPNGLIVYATADCTGHGVPGAFVSIICNNLLKLGTTRPEVNDPGEALDFANKELNEVMNSKYTESQIRDGMDVALCGIDPVERKLYFAGAKNGLYLLREGEVMEIKADRKAIGVEEGGNDFQFSTSVTDLKPGDMLYTLSDGFVDQFGGEDGKKFTSRRLKELLITIHQSGMNEQLELVGSAFEEWKGNNEQIDDVLLIGVRIN